MKHLFYIYIIFCVTLYVGCKQHTHEHNNTHTHVHGEKCTQNHDHDHEPHVHDAHTHEGHTHVHMYEHGADCTHDHQHDAHAHTHYTHNHEGDAHVHDAGDNHDDEITFTDAQASRIDFEVEQVVRRPFGGVISCSGDITNAPTCREAVVAPVGGRVVFAYDISEGVAVNSGDILFYIDTKSLASGDAAIKAKAEYERAKAEYERAQSLYDEKIVSQKHLDAAYATFLRAEAEYNPVATGNESGIAIKAVKAGHIANLMVMNGDYVEAGAVMASVVANKRLRLVAEVPQRYYSALTKVETANFTIDGKKIYDLSTLNGKVLSVGRSVAEGAALISITLEFDNPGDLVSGLYVETALRCRPEHDAVVIPVSALTEAQGIYYVYVQVHPEKYIRREVKLGANDGCHVVVTKGLHVGEHLVTRGAIQVKMAAASGAIPHGHSHNH